jgi:hypothetical protein
VAWQTTLPPERERAIIEQSIALQPQPAYQDEAGRIYAADIAGWKVRWSVADECASIVECVRA